MSRISGNFQSTQNIQQPETDGGTPGRVIAGEPTQFGNIPIPIAIIPFGPTVHALAPHHEAEPPPILTIGNPTIGPTQSTVTTTTTTTTATTASTSSQNVERVRSKPIRRMNRGLSEHRMRDRLAYSEQTARKEPPRSPSPMGRSAPLLQDSGSGSGSASQSADEAPKPMPPFLQKGTLTKEKSASRLKRQPSQHRLQRQLARTEDIPRSTRAEHSPPPMVSSAPDAPIQKGDADPPKEWKKAWRKQVKTIMKLSWCQKALSMVDTKTATFPDLATTLKTSRLMRAAYRDKLTATEAASIFLYTSALYKDINGSLLKGNLPKLRHNRREALETMIRNIDSGLEKLPLVTGRLVRVVNLEEAFGKTLKEGGEPWRGKAFGSCVRENDRNMKWDGNFELYFEMASGAHDVSDYSDAPKEREVLIERGYDYDIVDRDETGERVRLELKEIATTGKQT
jgi:ADP-ribosyltransferase exoenzyme